MTKKEKAIYTGYMATVLAFAAPEKSNEEWAAEIDNALATPKEIIIENARQFNNFRLPNDESRKV